MFVSNLLRMSHRHIVSFTRNKPINKDLIRVEREKVNNKLIKYVNVKKLISKKSILIYNYLIETKK